MTLHARIRSVLTAWSELSTGQFAAALAGIVVLALVMRVGVALWLPAEIVWSDGKRYEAVALSLLRGEGFGSLSINQRTVPTQAAIIAGVYAVFGQSYVALRLAFAVLGTATVLVGGLLAARLFGRPAGVLAALGVAGYPYLIYLSALFEYPQGFFILALGLFFLGYYRFRQTDSLAVLFGAVLCLGLAVLSVPTVLIFAAVFGVVLITRNVRRTLQRLAVCALAASVTVGAWAVRNHVAYDSLVVVNVAGGRAFWLGNNETYVEQGKSGVVRECGAFEEETPYCRDMLAMFAELDARGLRGAERVFEEDRMRWQLGLDFVREDPWRFVRLGARKFVDLWRPMPDAVEEGGAHGDRWRDYVAAATYVPMLVLAVLGVVWSAARWRELVPIYLFVVTFVAPFVVFYPTTRYRLPIDFLLIVFAGYGAARLLARSAVKLELAPPVPAALGAADLTARQTGN